MQIILPFNDEVEAYKSLDIASDLLGEALDSAEETYFYEKNWFREPTGRLYPSHAGYKNVCIIEFGVYHYDNGENDSYFAYDPDSWMYALNDIADEINGITDPAYDDNLQAYMLEHASYYGGDNFRTIVSEKFIMNKLKDYIEEDNNWTVDDEEIDYDSPTGLEVVESFTIEYEGGADLTEVFEEINEDFDEENPELVEMAKRMSGHIATLVSMLTSDGMNVLKASLLGDVLLTDTSLYSTLSGVTKINELNMTVEASIGWGDEISPERILQGIANNDDLNLGIKITCEDFDSLTIAFLKQMLVGEFKESNAWFIDAEKSLEGMIQANIQSLTKPKKSKV